MINKQMPFPSITNKFKQIKEVNRKIKEIKKIIVLSNLKIISIYYIIDIIVTRMIKRNSIIIT